MNVKRYFARTAREALGKLRADLGADAIVLKNRPVDGGVEILALADESLFDEPGAAQSIDPQDDRLSAPQGGRVAPTARSVDEEPMSTVSFETYVRERRQRRLAERDQGETAGAMPMREPKPQPMREAAIDPAAPQAASQEATSRSFADVPRPRSVRAPELRTAHAQSATGSATAEMQALLAEMREMRGAISEQIEAMSWFEGVRRRPAQSRLLRRLLQAGFSASLSRTLANHLPADFGDDEADRWLREALVRNLRIDSPEQTIFDQGGTYALLGPTGVGKTTTAAKIAAQFALKHGAQSVGLITADVYRIGAQDQLRTFGRLLGVPVHVAHDVATLADFLQLYMNKKLVLIDTAGVAQRDERVGELLVALSSAQVRKVLVVNAASQAEAIEEVVEAWQGRSAAGVVLSKVDEAVRLGGALDCLIRHRLPLQGVANGQRVPEDWHRPEPRMLVDRALSNAGSQASTSFTFEEAELAMLLTAGRASAADREREAARV